MVTPRILSLPLLAPWSGNSAHSHASDGCELPTPVSRPCILTCHIRAISEIFFRVPPPTPEDVRPVQTSRVKGHNCRPFGLLSECVSHHVSISRSANGASLQTSRIVLVSPYGQRQIHNRQPLDDTCKSIPSQSQKPDTPKLLGKRGRLSSCAYHFPAAVLQVLSSMSMCSLSCNGVLLDNIPG